MKRPYSSLIIVTLVAISTNCSSIKVIDAWKGDNIKTIRDQNILVIARAELLLPNNTQKQL